MKNILISTSFVILIMVALYLAYRDPIERGQEPVATKVVLSQIGPALKSFAKDCGRFPSEAEGLSVLESRSDVCGNRAMNWPYVNRKPLDGWGREFTYTNDGVNARIESVPPKKDEGPIYFSCRVDDGECSDNFSEEEDF